MASNILKRLRNPPFGMDTSERLLIEAAAEHVAALEADLAKEKAENARLREALEKIASFYPKDADWPGAKDWNRAGEYAAGIARAALR